MAKVRIGGTAPSRFGTTLRSLEGAYEDEDIVVTSSKAPKLRFKPGNIVRYQDKLYQVIFAYRVEETPHEWLFILEERSGILVDEETVDGEIERVIYEVFADQADAYSYYSRWPSRGRQIVVTNKDLVQKGEVVSSGEILAFGEVLLESDLALLPLLNPGD